MTDLRERLRAIESATPPDLWAAIESRALEDRPELGDGDTVRFPSRRPEWQRRIAVVAVAAALFALAAFPLWRAFRSTTPPLPPTPLDVPAGWTRCTNGVEGYSIGHPGSWHTTDILFGDQDPRYACLWFSPSPFDVVDDRGRPQGNVVSEGYGYELEVGIGEPLDRALRNRLDPDRYNMLVQEELVIDGHRAVRLEYETLIDLIAEPGLHYEYLIELDPRRTLIVHTTKTRGISGPNGEDYDENKRVVDLAASTVRFTDA